MRKDEVLGLRRDQANFEHGIISLFDTKNGERRDIPMNETVKATLRGIENESPYFFYNEEGGRGTLWRCEKGVCNGIEEIRDSRFQVP